MTIASEIQNGNILDTDQTVTYSGRSKQFWANDRCTKAYNVPYEQIGGRIYYRRSILDDFLAGKFNKPKGKLTGKARGRKPAKVPA